MQNKKIIILIPLLVSVFVISGCSFGKEKKEASQEQQQLEQAQKEEIKMQEQINGLQEEILNGKNK